MLVTGGRGTLGRKVVAGLLDAGLHVRVLSRRDAARPERIEFVKGDLTTGEGVEAAVTGAEVIVHCAGTNKGDDVKAQKLVRSAARTGRRSSTSWHRCPGSPRGASGRSSSGTTTS